MANRFEQARNTFDEVPATSGIDKPKPTNLNSALNPTEVLEKTKPTQITLYPSDKEKLKMLKNKLNRKSVSEVIRDLINAEFTRQFPE